MGQLITFNGVIELGCLLLAFAFFVFLTVYSSFPHLQSASPIPLLYQQ